ncbi:putative ER lumen protein retaining receptor [Lupinus albus]|uniref:Putative ER lumen protein retaining receptor n=1 Tax=Lupinus albus TaxID=3870 RepID=A0A6A4PP57_LUPAL|nr:putative ER lumen protein retaining receptor [Lupinus albus]
MLGSVSLKTQELMAIFLAARLICSIFIEANIHTLLDLTSLLSVLLVIWMIRFRLKSSYLKELDTLPLSFVVVPCAVIAVIIHPATIQIRFSRTLWAFSIYLEAVSVLPQLRYMQNAKMIETLTGKYVFALGVSKFFGLAHWIIQGIVSGRVTLLLQPIEIQPLLLRFVPQKVVELLIF